MYARHGLSNTPTYRSWVAMVQRVTNPDDKDFYYYGGRGIDLDPRWLEFPVFLKDMGIRPDNTTIERIENEIGYWPSNCRWASPTDQNRNKRSNIIVEYEGKLMCVAEALELSGITWNTLKSYMSYNELTHQEALDNRILNKKLNPNSYADKTVIFKGRILPMKEACELIGIKYGTVVMRMRRGKTLAQASNGHFSN